MPQHARNFLIVRVSNLETSILTNGDELQMNNTCDENAIAPAINVTPMIDILLVLLIIFMVVSPLKPSRFKALVPQEPDRNKNVLPDVNTLVVNISSDLQLSLNGEQSLGSVNDTAPLSTRLATVFQERADKRIYRREVGGGMREEADRIEKTVFIKAPRSLTYGEVAKVIDGVKGAGARPVGLQIDDLSE